VAESNTSAVIDSNGFGLKANADRTRASLLSDRAASPTLTQPSPSIVIGVMSWTEPLSATRVKAFAIGVTDPSQATNTEPSQAIRTEPSPMN